MKNLGNKLMIYLFCILQIWIPTTPRQLAACCLSVITACLLSCFDQKRVQLFLFLLYSLLCIAEPAFSIFLPVLLYDAFRNTHGGHPPAAYIVLAAVFFTLPHHNLGGLLYQLLLCLLSYMMQRDSRKIDTLLTEYHTCRDNSTEKTMRLKEKNAALILQQDYEISLAMASERNRIARDIHDNVGHMLTRSILQTGAIQVINQDTALKQPICELRDTLNTAMTSIRSSVHNLHQDTIDFKHTIGEIIRATPQLDILLKYDIDSPLPTDLQYAFIAIIREAVNNVTKHSNADRVSIQLKEHPALFQLVIADNGTGEVKITHSGIGLTSMQERVNSLHGNIHFSTDGGFQIFISIMKTAQK